MPIHNKTISGPIILNFLSVWNLLILDHLKESEKVRKSQKGVRNFN